MTARALRALAASLVAVCLVPGQVVVADEEAIKLATRHKVLIITGGPGVGKTTIVDSILRIFSAKGFSACFLPLQGAPPNRASR